MQKIQHLKTQIIRNDASDFKDEVQKREQFSHLLHTKTQRIVEKKARHLEETYTNILPVLSQSQVEKLF